MRENPKLYIALALIPQLILIKILSFYPEFIETYYSNGIYPWTSKLFRWVFGWLPFSFGDIFYTLSSIYILRWIFKNRWRILKDTKNWVIEIFATISILFFAFHFLWALNYYRQPLHKNLNLNADYTTEQLVEVTKMLIEESNTLHNALAKNDSTKIDIPYSKSDIFNLAPEGFKNLQLKYPHLAYEPSSVKYSIYSLALTYMGFSGYLNPLTNEAQVDRLIPIFKFPTTASHEIAHQLGYAAENEANFIGALAAMNHKDIYFNYSGYTFALRHCLFEVYKRDSETYYKLLETVNYGIIKNYQEVQQFWDSYQNPLEPIFKETYDSFLIANNQKKGMQSYNYVVALYVNYFLSTHS